MAMNPAQVKQVKEKRINERRTGWFENSEKKQNKIKEKRYLGRRDKLLAN